MARFIMLINCLFLMNLLCYFMFPVSAIPTPQDTQKNDKIIPTTNTDISSPSKIPSNRLLFTGGHWFNEPNMITFFVRMDESVNIDTIPSTYLIIGNSERILMSSHLNNVSGIGLIRTGMVFLSFSFSFFHFFFFLLSFNIISLLVSFPRNGHCREYHFETLQFGNINRWPKNNDLLTVEGDRCLMPISKSGFSRIKMSSYIIRY